MSTPDMKTLLLDGPGVEQALSRMAREIMDDGVIEDLMLVGIHRRGVELAERIAALISETAGRQIKTGSLDITLYRDDFDQIGPRPVIGSTAIPGDINGLRVVIVDDVLYTGRTVKAALTELADFGRPRRVELCVLADRGGRELPIQADHVGIAVEVGEGERVEVRVPELDDELSVTLVSSSESE
ncbi:MAG: bifunctional pyr operon transcriptional regulator/uracil phosphoribosyltransferase PyrR [Gemmatimonadetes bacterium]|nr:bifunctional pyr operon transcriptional regulator/uracil phosphoribosyltransferase PyrR [Gemmatimonadota bacterium]NNK49667.1 bifunctional pyr operon transcriptional regulator/uracil phosphoribosyltransferase PyrR [Gemmatimonadota bacterium]